MKTHTIPTPSANSLTPSPVRSTETCTWPMAPQANRTGTSYHCALAFTRLHFSVRSPKPQGLSHQSSVISHKSSGSAPSREELLSRMAELELACAELTQRAEALAQQLATKETALGYYRNREAKPVREHNGEAAWRGRAVALTKPAPAGPSGLCLVKQGGEVMARAK